MLWFIFCLPLVNCFHLNSHLVTQLFLQHGVHRGLVLTCSDKKGQASIFRGLAPTNALMLTTTHILKMHYLELLYSKHSRIGVVLDGDCKEAQTVITKSGYYRFFDVKYYWLIFSRKKSFKSLFSKADVNIDSNIWGVRASEVYDIYSPASKKGGPLLVTKLGPFNNATRFMPSWNKFWQRRDLSGITFRSTFVLHEPYSGPVDEYMKSTHQKELNTYNRVQATFINYCRDHYNFSYTFNTTSLFGYQKGDGTLDGMVGDLERRKIDFGLSPLFTREDRCEVITYGRRTFLLRSAFVFRNPKSKTMFGLFLRPFTSGVWYCLLGLFFLSVGVLKAIWGGPESSWTYSILSVIGIFAQQGIAESPKKLSRQIGVLFILTVAYFALIFYSGSLVSSLLNLPLDLIESVDDIIDAGFQVGLQDVRLNREYLKYTSERALIRFNDTLIKGKESQVYLSPQEGLRRMTKGRYAFHVELVKAYTFIKEHFKEGACETREVLMFKPMSLYASYAFQGYHGRLVRVISMSFHDLHRIAESGVMEKQLAFWTPKKPACLYEFNIHTGIAETSPVLMSLAIGYGVSLGILVFELILAKNKKP